MIGFQLRACQHPSAVAVRDKLPCFIIFAQSRRCIFTIREIDCIVPVSRTAFKIHDVRVRVENSILVIFPYLIILQLHKFWQTIIIKLCCQQYGRTVPVRIIAILGDVSPFVRSIHICHHNVGFIGIKYSYRPFLTIFHTFPIHVHNRGIQLVDFCRHFF